MDMNGRLVRDDYDGGIARRYGGWGYCTGHVW